MDLKFAKALIKFDNERRKECKEKVNRDGTVSRTTDDSKCRYVSVLHWIKTRAGYSIPKCINSVDACKSLAAFCSQHSDIFDFQFVLALSSFMVEMIPLVFSPKMLVDADVDYDGNLEITVCIEDEIHVLNHKIPTSRPRRDPKAIEKKVKKKEDRYRKTKPSYLFGIRYEVATRIYRIYYKMYPHKTLYGYRYRRGDKDPESILKLIVFELANYFADELLDESTVFFEPEKEEEGSFQEDEHGA